MLSKLFKNKSIVFKASIVYVVVGFLNKAIGIITIPIFTRLLSTAEMGVSTTYISWQLMIYPVTSLSLVSGSLFLAMKEFKNERDKYESSILSISTLVTIVVFTIYLCFHTQLNTLLTLPTELITFMFICLLFQPALDIWMVRQRYEYKVRKMAIVTLATNVGSALVAVLAVLYFQNKGTNLGIVRIGGTYGTIALFSLYFFIFIFKRGRTFYNKKFWDFAIKLSIPLMFHTIGKNILDVSDQSMISLLCGKSEAGIYGTIYSVASLSLIVWTAINNAFVPYLFEKLDSNTDRDVHDVNRITMVLLLLFAAASLCLTAIAPEIVRLLMTDAYFGAAYLIPAITGGIYLTCVYNIFANVVLYYKKPSYIMYGTLFAAAVNILLNFVLIRKFGYQAAAYNTLIACVLLSLVQGFAMSRVRKKPLYNYKTVFLISAGTIILSLSFNVLYRTTLIRYLVIVAIAAIIFAYRNKIKNMIFELKEADTNE